MSTIHVKEILMRPPTLEDAPAAVELFNAHAKSVIGNTDFTVEDLTRDWQTPGLDLARDTRVVFSPEGQMLGYYEVWDLDKPHVLFFIWGRIHPDYDIPQVADPLLQWVEQRSQMAVEMAPHGTRVAVRSFINQNDHSNRSWVEKFGFRPIRKNLRMIIELNGKPEEPVWPEGIEIRSMVPGQDERKLFAAVRDAFKDHWGYVERPFEEELERWKHSIANNPDHDPELYLMAMDGNEVAGMSLCLSHMYDDPDLGWVSSLGVRRPWRRRGLALALLQQSFKVLHKRGRRRIGLGVDAESLTGALRLYEKAGMHSDPRHEYVIYEKELRSGVDLSTRNVEAE